MRRLLYVAALAAAEQSQRHARLFVELSCGEQDHSNDCEALVEAHHDIGVHGWANGKARVRRGPVEAAPPSCRGAAAATARPRARADARAFFFAGKESAETRSRLRDGRGEKTKP